MPQLGVYGSLTTDSFHCSFKQTRAFDMMMMVAMVKVMVILM